MASFMAVTTVSTSASAQQPKKPNIVFMLMDNVGYGELGVYGGGILPGAPAVAIMLPRQIEQRGSKKRCAARRSPSFADCG
jgi:hypothetical protein